jgi:hypothetical protein
VAAGIVVDAVVTVGAVVMVIAETSVPSDVLSGLFETDVVEEGRGCDADGSDGSNATLSGEGETVVATADRIAESMMVWGRKIGGYNREIV